MISRALVNGVESDVLRLQDRGLHYGDGVFRTLLVDGGVALELEAQLSRLHGDARHIGLDAPDVARLRQEAQALCHGTARGVLKIMLTRGESARPG